MAIPRVKRAPTPLELKALQRKTAALRLTEKNRVRDILLQTIEDSSLSPVLRTKAALTYERLIHNKPPVSAPEVRLIEKLTATDAAEMRTLLRREADFSWLAKEHKDREFWLSFQGLAERSLYIFAKLVLGMNALTTHLHKPVCDWLQDVSISRRKLLMLPVVHLKTTIGSHCFPIHVLIQPARTNKYFPGREGADMRILLNGKSANKARENLAVIKQHFESNRLLRALWPNVCWPDPAQEAPVWKDDAITVKRKKIVPEPSVTAIGVGTKLHGRHYDIIVADDIATMEAAQSEIVMERARMHRKGLLSRLNDPNESLELGIGTHWTANDIYVEWRKDPAVEVIVRSAIENGVPIWPERHSLDSLLALQKKESMGSVLFSANYMNNPLNSAFSALDWGEIRMFHVERGYLIFDTAPADQSFANALAIPAHEQIRRWHLEGNLRGKPLSSLFPIKSSELEETPEQLERRKLRVLQRKLAVAAEGSATWVRMNELVARQRARLQEERHEPN